MRLTTSSCKVAVAAILPSDYQEPISRLLLSPSLQGAGTRDEYVQRKLMASLHDILGSIQPIVTSSAAFAGNFSTLTINSPPNPKGCGYNAKQQRDPSSFAVLVSPKFCAKSGLRVGAIAAIVIASVVGAAVPDSIVEFCCSDDSHHRS